MSIDGAQTEPSPNPDEMSTSQLFAAALTDTSDPSSEPVTDDTPVVEPTEVAEEPQPEPQPQPEPETNDDLVRLVDEQYGANFSEKYKTDDDFLKGIVEAQKLIGQRNEDAEYGRQMRAMEPQIQAAIAAQQRQQAQIPQGPQTPQPAQTIPQVSYEQATLWANQVRQNPETGELEPLPGASPQVVEDLKQHAERVRRTAHELTYNPDKFIAQAIEQRMQGVDQYIQQAIGQTTAQQQAIAESEQWIEGNRDWIFINGDPSQGNTAAGEQFINEYYTRLKPQVDMGIKSNRQVLEESFDLFQRALPPAPPAPPAQAAHRPPIANPQAQGVVPDPPEMQDGETTFQFMQRTMEYNQKYLKE